jgi:hypothetical protein
MYAFAAYIYEHGLIVTYLYTEFMHVCNRLCPWEFERIRVRLSVCMYAWMRVCAVYVHAYAWMRVCILACAVYVYAQTKYVHAYTCMYLFV